MFDFIHTIYHDNAYKITFKKNEQKRKNKKETERHRDERQTASSGLGGQEEEGYYYYVGKRAEKRESLVCFIIRMEMDGTGWVTGGCANRDEFVWFLRLGY